MNTQVKTVEAAEVLPSHASLAAAKCAVMGEIKRLKKADENEFAKYMFTSVDDFKDAIRPLMVKHGLIPHVNQTAFEALELLTTDKAGREKKSAVIRFDFDICLEHVASNTVSAPEKITVALPYTGAQTSGAARSYAIKEWMKGSFLASSGDSSDETDHRATVESEGARLAKAEARKLYAELSAGLDKAIKTRTPENIEGFWKANEARLNTLPKDWYLMLRGTAEDAFKATKEGRPASATTPVDEDAGEILAKAEQWFDRAPDRDELEAAWSQFEHYQETLGKDDANTLRDLYEAAVARFAGDLK